MIELTYNAKIAVLRILSDILNADGIVHEKEVKYFEEIVESFELPDHYKHDLDNCGALQALSVVRVLPAEVKADITKLMGRMIIVDENIHYNEVKLYNTVCEACNIKNGFDFDDPFLSI